MGWFLLMSSSTLRGSEILCMADRIYAGAFTLKFAIFSTAQVFLKCSVTEYENYVE